MIDLKIGESFFVEGKEYIVTNIQENNGQVSVVSKPKLQQ